MRGLEDIERELLLYPHIVKTTGVDQWKAPIQFTQDDIRDVIIALHSHRQNLLVAFDSEHDFRDYPGLSRKNQIHSLTAAYDAYIREDSMKHFAAIEQFLKNPRNELLKEQYHPVADELKDQLIVHRNRFSSFDQALEDVCNLRPQ